MCWNILSLRPRVASRLLRERTISCNEPFTNCHQNTYPHCMITRVKKLMAWARYNNSLVNVGQFPNLKISSEKGTPFFFKNQKDLSTYHTPQKPTDENGSSTYSDSEQKLSRKPTNAYAWNRSLRSTRRSVFTLRGLRRSNPNSGGSMHKLRAGPMSVMTQIRIICIKS